MNGPRPDVVIIGAGIVGAACAWRLARERLGVHILEAGVIGGGATAAGMGHIVVMDDSEAEFALTSYSRDLWLRLAPELPADCEFRRCGTIWVAADPDEFSVGVEQKHAWYRQRDVQSQILDARALRDAEPNLREGLSGGLLVRDDAVVYAPCAARWFIERAVELGAVFTPRVRAATLDAGGVATDGGERISCATVVCAGGCDTMRLLPDVGIRPRKGHLAITDRYPGFLNHQLVELGYLKSAHGAATESVAFNAQPRATGQLLLGSSRQFGDDTDEIRWPILARMLERGFEYMPALRQLSVIRTWTGFRAATTDGMPLIGPWPPMPNVLLATGHEGLGITTAPATAELIAAAITGTPAAISGEPWLPSRQATRVRTHA